MSSDMGSVLIQKTADKFTDVEMTECMRLATNIITVPLIPIIGNWRLCFQAAQS